MNTVDYERIIRNRNGKFLFFGWNMYYNMEYAYI
jgi:hypothetical protein